MIKIVPLVSSRIDYDTLFLTCKEMLGRSITSGLDARGILTRTPAGFLHVLSEIDPSEEFGTLLNHLSYSFLVVSDSETVLDICLHGDLKVYSEPANYKFRLSIISGTLLEWRTTLINSLSPVSTDLVRIILEQCLLHFEKEGLGNLWNDYRKKRHKDKTLFLEHK